MYKNIFKQVTEEESIFFFLGWTALAFFFSWGNTSLGIIFLIIHTLITAWKKRKFPYNFKSKISFLLVILICWGFFTSIFAYNSSIAFLSAAGFALLVYIVYFGSTRLALHKDFLMKILLPLAITGITISSLYTILTYTSQTSYRSHTFFVRFNGTGTLMIIAFSILLGYFEYFRNKKRYLLLIPAGLVIATLFISYSRGSLLGFFAALTFYNLKSKKHVFILLLVLILITGVIFTSPGLEKNFLSVFSLEDNQDRVYIWKSTLNMIKDHPLTGIGPGNYPFLFMDYIMPEDNRGHTVSYSHNIFSNMAAETGIIGLVLFILIFIYLLKMGYYISYINPLYRGLFAALIGLTIREQVDCTILGLEIGASFWLIAGLITAFYYIETGSAESYPITSQSGPQ